MQIDDMRTALQRRGGPLSVAEADAVARAALSALATVVPPADRGGLRAVLPEGLRDSLAEPYGGPQLDEAGLAQVLQERSGLPAGRALELATVVYDALAAALDRDALARLERHLPDTVAARLQPPAPQRAGHDTGVAGGRRAQRGSIAAWDGSRDDRTLGGFRKR